MEKINFEENLKKGLSCEEIFKNFFKQIYQNKELEEEYQKNSDVPADVKKSVLDRDLEIKLNNIEVVDLHLDPRIKPMRVYCVCSNEEIKKLLELGDEYLTVNTSIVKINKLKRHKAMKFKVYNINVNEDAFATKISLCIIEEPDLKEDLRSSAEYAKKVIVAQDVLACAKSILDYYDVMF